ncbi:hypothetical protein XENTR_v10007679 [Xenopus tropicalis]|nr:hypothetical protein XENTR_v10007679 [Xenopus tropicalis]
MTGKYNQQAYNQAMTASFGVHLNVRVDVRVDSRATVHTRMYRRMLWLPMNPHTWPMRRTGFRWGALHPVRRSNAATRPNTLYQLTGPNPL